MRWKELFWFAGRERGKHHGEGKNAREQRRKHQENGPLFEQKTITFWNDERGQVSAEMLIIIAALIAVAIVLIGQLQNSAKTGAKNLEAKTDKAWSELEKIGK